MFNGSFNGTGDDQVIPSLVHPLSIDISYVNSHVIGYAVLPHCHKSSFRASGLSTKISVLKLGPERDSTGSRPAGCFLLNVLGCSFSKKCMATFNQSCEAPYPSSWIIIRTSPNVSVAGRIAIYVPLVISKSIIYLALFQVTCYFPNGKSTASGEFKGDSFYFCVVLKQNPRHWKKLII